MVPPAIPFLDLRVSDPDEKRLLLAAVDRVLDHGRLINGPEVAALEQQVALRCGRRHGLGVASGTDALYIALRALGLGTGDEVIVPALSWVATANAVALTGARPVFADIGDDLNIDPAAAARCITARTRAILPVHYTGKICDMAALGRLADRHGLILVEDAAQAFGAEQAGRPAGAFGQVGCFSMNCMKVWAACGEAGMLVTDDAAFYERMTALRYNGTVNRETCILVGLNGRMDTVQAAILLRRLERLPDLLARRRAVAEHYRRRLQNWVETPSENPGARDACYTFTIRCDRRDALQADLAAAGIETKIQHPILMCDQPVYRRSEVVAVPNARRLVDRILCLPASEKISDDEVDRVCDRIGHFYAGKGA